jgi:hypothetical protein
MAIPANVLGRVLADLYISQKKDRQSTEFIISNQRSEIEEKLLEKIRIRFKELAASSNWKQVCEQLSEYRCQTDFPFLRGNTDFFLAFLFLTSDNLTNECEKFFKHLNNCYQCYEEFTEVMRYYFNRLKDLDAGGL